MADSIIEYPRLNSSSNNIVNRWDTTTIFDGSVQKSCGVVNLFYRGYDSTKSHIAQLLPLAEIPEGYRPQVTIPLGGTIKLADEDFYRGCVVFVYANGTITLNFSSSKYIEDLFILGSYGVP